MTGWTEARLLAYELGRAQPRGAESLPLAGLAGRTLTSDLHSPTALPGYASSAMDGWVVAGDAPWRLGQAILAGDSPSDTPLGHGTARPIATGGPIPPGALGVLRSEHGSTTTGTEGGDPAALWLRPGPAARVDEPRNGEHIRPLGEEANRGDLLLVAGVVLTPPRLALAAVAGLDVLRVERVPRIDVTLLGDEVVTAGLPRAGEVRDAYSPQFPGLFRSMGAEIEVMQRVSDNLASTVRAFATGTAALQVSTGGTGRGPADHVRAALSELGATLELDGVAMRPGHPVILARRIDGRLILCLPGNPLAAMIAFLSFGRPLIEGMLGRSLSPLGSRVLADDVANASRQTRLVTFTETTAGIMVTPHQGSGMLRGLADADGILIVPAGGCRAGEAVTTLPLPW
jgi:molybdopterin molybdotransferase